MLDYKELETLISIVDMGSFDGAARKLHVSAGAVSQRMKSLETSVGRPVLIRSLPPRLTAMGEQVIQYARQIMLLQHEMGQLLPEATSDQPLSLAVNHDSLNCWFMEVIESFQLESSINIDIRATDIKSTLALLKRGDVVGAVTSMAEQVPGCKSCKLGSLVYDGVCSRAFFRKHFSKDGMTSQSLSSAPVLCYDQFDDLADQYLALFDVEAENKNVNNIPSTHLIVDAVLKGLGWAMVPRLYLESYSYANELLRLSHKEVSVELYWKGWDLNSQTLNVLEKTILQVSDRRLKK